ncbi:MAG: peptide chain release factor N(5)-glutamine methyltransferase, partial [Pseudomonadota bacterium]|nr:peptide chain release factor N(5)-glutamine methyltransferase [Pseudomonadota bacterium]
MIVIIGKAPTPSIRSLLTQGARLLDTGSARLDAEVLLAACLGKPRSYLYAWPDRPIEAALHEQFITWIKRRAGGEPVAYLTGQREFWSLPLSVTPATLIPRPETETLVILALEKIAPDRTLWIADLGTGCGAIALAIAKERPRCKIIATDISENALSVARTNADKLGIANVQFAAGDWCRPLPAIAFDFILSNPPYVAQQDPHLDAGDVRFEPRDALAAGPEGLDALRQIALCAGEHLCEKGWLMVEHGYEQGGKVTQLFRTEGFRGVSDHPDDTGLSRVTMGW